LSSFGAGTRAGGCASLRSGVRIGASRGIYSSLCSPHRVAARATVPRGGAGDPSALITDPSLHTRVYRGVCSGVHVRSGIHGTPGIYSSLCSSRRVAARDTLPGTGADDPNGLIADPRSRTSAYRGVCSYIRGRSGVQSTHGIYPDLWCSGRVTARAAISRRCGGGDGTGLIASARSGSRRLRQTQWYRRNADRNHSKPNRFDLIHIIFPPSEAPFV